MWEFYLIANEMKSCKGGVDKFEQSLDKIQQFTGPFILDKASPPVDLYLISEKSIWKNQV